MIKIISKLIIFAGIFTVLFTGLFAYEKKAIDKVLKYLSKKWYYYDKAGNKIKVKKLMMQYAGKNYKIIVNGKSIDPAGIYSRSGKNIINPLVYNNAPREKIVGNEKGEMKGITEAHNKFRKGTGSGLPDLVWDENLAAYAGQWANFLKRTNNCRMKHRWGIYKKRSYGENLAWSSGREMEADYVVQLWYDEIKYYNYAANSCSGVCGHYTQVVWKNSKRVGCAMAKCARSEVWVCNYDPPGNYIGQRPY